MTTIPDRTELVGKIVDALDKMTTSEVRFHLKTKYFQMAAEDVQSLMAEGEQIATARQAQRAAAAKIERKAALKARLAKARAHLNDTDQGIDRAAVDALERSIRDLLDDEDLEGFNVDLRRKGRALTYPEIALIGCIHRRSIKENKGESPFKRIKVLAEKSGLLAAGLTIDHRQIRYALNILAALGFTEEIEIGKPGVFKDGKWAKGTCGKWCWTDPEMQ